MTGWAETEPTGWVLGDKPKEGNDFARQDLLVLIFVKWSD